MTHVTMQPSAATAEAVLTETGSRLAEINKKFGFDTSVPPEETDWVCLGAAEESGFVEDLGARLLEVLGRPNVAGSYLGARLTDPLVSRTVAALLTDRRCPDPALRDVFVHRRDVKIDRIAFTGSVAVLGDDPRAGCPGVVVLEDLAALRAWWAERVVDAVDPLLNSVRRRFRFGLRGLWGAVAGRVGSTAVALDRGRGGSGETGWRAAELLLDALAAYAPVRIVRPTPLAVNWSGGTSCFSVKGTCCLKYLVKPECDLATGSGFCSACPLVAEPCLQATVIRKLERSSGDA